MQNILFFKPNFYSVWLVKSAVREWKTQVCGYHGDPNEPMAADLTFLFVLVLFALCVQFIYPNVRIFSADNLTEQKPK